MSTETIPTEAKNEVPTESPELRRENTEVNPREMSLESKIQFLFEKMHNILYSDHKPDSRYRESAMANSIETFLMLYERRNDTAVSIITEADINQITVNYNQGSPVVFTTNSEWYGYLR